MKFSILAKSAISYVLLKTGTITRSIKRHFKSDEFVVLMYHRIIEYDKTVQPGMYVTPATFRLHLAYLEKHFTVISLAELVSRLASKKVLTGDGKPVCVITFDDGWIDFYQNAYPALKAFGFPATVFLPTDYINSDRKFWTDQLANILFELDQSQEVTTSATTATILLDEFKSLPGSFSEKLDTAAERLKTYDSETIKNLLSEMTTALKLPDNRKSRNFINWQEVQEMHASGLISFGSHTVTHEILTTIPENRVKRELEQSKLTMLGNGSMDASMISFCYPNGNYSDQIAEMVRQSGYHVAVTTRNGWNNHHSDMMTLNRVGVHQDITSNTGLFASRLAGIF